MIKQISMLSKLLLSNLFGINQLRYSKDKKEKFRYAALLLVWICVIACFEWLLVGFFKTYIKIGFGNIIPVYMYAIVSIITVVLTFFKAGSILFSVKDYDMLISLPVSKTAIVVSRFVSMYITSLLASLVVIVPGTAVYGYYIKPGIMFYLISVAAVLFLPMLPLTIASVAGAVITAISTRMKNKNIAEILLNVLLVFAVLYLGTKLGSKGENMTPEMMIDIASIVTRKIKQLYIPAGWYGEAVDGNVVSFILLILVPLAIFAAFAIVVGIFFQNICSAINAVSAKNNYEFETLKSSSVLKALWKKELKRYFASSIYVVNTMIGYVMAAVLPIAVLVVGKEKLLSTMGMTMFLDEFGSIMPIILSLMFSITSTTACSISLEGNTLWQIKILPVRSIDVYNSKILLNLTVAAPFYLVSVVAAMLVVKPDIVNGIMIAAFPLCYIIFNSVLGITINIHFPNFNWENEVTPVKQGASVMLSMLIGIVAAILPIAAIYYIKSADISMILIVTMFVLVCVTGGMYAHIRKNELISL